VATEAEYDYVMDVNVRGVFLCCKRGIPVMLGQGGGAIVNLASVASFVGFRNDAAYCASKGAVLMLTRQLSLDYPGSGVRVNAICPGFIETTELLSRPSQRSLRATTPRSSRARLSSSTDRS
jgi:NAD(P)-dependent dehydrogenase (short-subunit alcohol dehydrogenase family)